LATAGGGWYYWRQRAIQPQERYKTQQADRGDIVQTISANGTLNPVVLVNVGTQVSGTVKRLHADFNDPVRSGQVLAELDPALFEAQLRQDEANLLNARANFTFAQAKEERTRNLFRKGFVSPDALDQAVQQLETARAQVALAQAQVERDRTNLRYTVIRSPIDGVVVARNVDVGQTVAASFQTPTLFQIAKDLRDMQIDTSMAEADIGGVEIGMPVRFTVDAFPDRRFEGTVRQIRLNPTVQQNVVTYNVVVAVDNADGKLLPGMTAHVEVTVGRRNNVLRVPNAALRFKPEKEENEGPRKNRSGQAGPTVYRLEQGRLKPVKLRLGISDGSYTEVVEGDLRAGDQLVTREIGARKEKPAGFGFRVM
jgi:HlyD family secretion protein